MSQLRIEFLHYWHCGGGRGGGASLDARVHRDGEGLPCVPGRHLRGLMRAALECGEAWQWPGFERIADQLFGERTEGKAGFLKPGSLRVSDAVLVPAEGAWLGQTDAGRKRLPGLFRNLHATAIDPKTGTAKTHSLRGIEVVVPLILHAEIEALPGSVPPEEWQTQVRAALPLVTAVGAHRSRGLGRARLSLEDV